MNRRITIKKLLIKVDKEVLDNPLLIPAVVHFNAMRSAIITGSGLYTAPPYKNDSSELVFEVSFAEEVSDELKKKFEDGLLQTLSTFFSLANVTYEARWEA